MPTDLENLKTRRSAIYTELAALDSTKVGGTANQSGGGTNTDHVGYKDGLYRELAQINELIAIAGGEPFEITSVGSV